MTKDRIKDIDTIRELLEDAENLSQLERGLLILRAFGVDTDRIEETF